MSCWRRVGLASIGLLATLGCSGGTDGSTGGYDASPLPPDGAYIDRVTAGGEGGPAADGGTVRSDAGVLTQSDGGPVVLGNCVGATGRSECVCTPRTETSCFPGNPAQLNVGVCRPGRARCVAMSEEFGRWGACEGAITASMEACDGLDNDCDGVVDNGCGCRPGATRMCYSGPMGTAGVARCRAGSQTCVAATSGAADWGPCAGEALPMMEVCNGTDDNCNGMVDEGCACVPGTSRACYSGAMGTMGVGVCRGGTQMCDTTGRSYGPCTGERGPGVESCNGIDDDCDGTVDEGLGCTCVPNMMRSCYSGPMGTAGVGPCHAGTQQCGPAGTIWGMCSGERTPVPESCNGIDDNCNGRVDETCLCTPGAMRSCYSGPAGTMGVGVCRAGTQVCDPGGMRWGLCSGERVPSAEICNSMDDDCNGRADELPSCAPPTAACPGMVTGAAGTPVPLAAMASAGGACLWEVVSRPAGAGVEGTFANPSACATTFSSVIVGTYTARVTVTDAMGRRVTCMTTITLTGRGLRVELTWNTTGDVDLHMLHPTAPAWFNTPNDCYYANRTPSWDAMVPTSPQLDVDNVTANGPENIRIDGPITGFVYRVGVHAYSRVDAGAMATVRIYCGSTTTPTRTFMRTIRSQTTSTNNDFWRVSDVRINPDGSCTLMPIDDVVTATAARAAR